MKKESFLSSIGSSVLWKGLDQCLGLIKHIVIAGAIGLSAQLDVFYMAVALLGVFVFSWANLIDVIAVPTMVELHKNRDLKEFHKVTGGMLSLSFIFSAICCLLLVSFNNDVAFIAGGFEENRKKLLEQAILWLTPVILFYIPLRCVGSVLRAIRQFSVFYKSEFLIALVVLVCVIGFKENKDVLLWSFSLAITISLCYLSFKARHWIFPLKSPFSSSVYNCLTIAPGLLVLQGAHYVYVLCDRMFISYLPEGSVSAAAYALTITSLLPSLASLGGAFITILSEEKMRETRSVKINQVISGCIFLSVCAVSILLTAGDAGISVLLERGVFTSADTQMVSTAISAYAFMILPMFLLAPFDQVFQVERKVSFMVRRTLVGLVGNVIFNGLSLFVFKWGLWGVALATSISYWLMLISGLQGIRGIGYKIMISNHIKWMVWISTALKLTCILLSDLGMNFTNPFLEVTSYSISILATALIAGVIYPGYEGGLVRKVILRMLAKLRAKI